MYSIQYPFFFITESWKFLLALLGAIFILTSTLIARVLFFVIFVVFEILGFLLKYEHVFCCSYLPLGLGTF